MSEAISIQLAELSKERAAMNDLQAAVQKLYDKHGSGYCFPSDLIWKYLTGLQPNGTEKPGLIRALDRSEEHTSELQSLMRISYAVFCLKKKKIQTNIIYYIKRNLKY